jgi:phosphotransferase system enzyme I (PtsP)
MSAMLNTLRTIVQEVNSAKDLRSVLDIIVLRVKEAMKVQMCSVYLLSNTTNRYVLMATDGLNKDAVGRVSLALNEGLVGLVGQREEPINLEEASTHPRFHYLAETGEEKFHSFLGVPIIHHRKVLGVMVVQQRRRRVFKQGDEAFMVTMAVQLAGVIAHARATGSMSGLSLAGEIKRDTQFIGAVGSHGVAIGEAVVVNPWADLSSVSDKTCEDVQTELGLFDHAIQSVRDDLSEAHEKLSDSLPEEELGLFDAYARMLDDNAIAGEVRELIEQGLWAQGALRQVIEEHVGHFEMMEDEYLRERAVDVKDLGSRVLEYLQEETEGKRIYPDDTILIGEELTASLLAEVPRGKLLGLISIRGSTNSHVAILARAMGIPTVMGAAELPLSLIDGKEVIIDGYQGCAYANPSSELRRRYKALIEDEKKVIKGLEALRDLPCETQDQYRIALWVNIGLVTDVARSRDHGAEGVGLYRTEVPFMMSDRFPSEEEQCDIYRAQLQAFAPHPVTMRTLDIGGDKSLEYFPIEEDNPFLGWRGIRVTLDHPEIFLLQVRAMMRASEGLDNLRIMLPMVSNVSEVEEALRLINRVYFELCQQGLKITMPPIGVMIEVPGAIYLVKQFAQRVQFLSIGSNDLTQYILAVDRNNARVASLYNSFHPAVLQSLNKIAVDAKKENISVSVCGEMAGDPASAVLLMAMGYDTLSMNAINLLRVKSAIRQITHEFAKKLLDEVLEMEDPLVIRSWVDLRLQQAGLDKLLRPVK